jgi:predicted porin
VAYDGLDIVFPGGQLDYQLGLDIVFPGGQLDYQLGFVYRGKGSGPQDQTSEKGLVAAVSLSFVNDVLSTAVGRYIELNPIVEYAHFWDADGTRDQTRDYVTVAANLLVGGWTFGAGYAWRQTNPPGGGSTRDYFYTVQGGYQFVNQLQIELGWKYGKEGGQEAQVLALTVSYEYDW